MMTIRSTFLIMVVTLAIPVVSLAQGKVLKSVCSDAGSEGKDTVLSICITEQGMRSGVQRELYIRLYADGHGEYEVTTPMPDGAAETGTALLKKEFSAENVEVSEILRLGRSPGFQKARDSYSALVHKTDSSSLTIIEFSDRGRTKQIALSNFYDRSPANKEHYPASVKRIMEKAGEIRRRAMGTVGRN